MFLACNRHKIINWVFHIVCWCQSKQLVLANCWTLYSWSNSGISVFLSKQSCVPQFCQWSDKLLSCLNPSLLTPALGPSSCLSFHCTYHSSKLSMSHQKLLLSYICIFMCFRSLQSNHTCYAVCQQDGAYATRLTIYRTGKLVYLWRLWLFFLIE